MTRKEAYQILGLTPGAGKTEIKKKYRRLMMQAHPDAALSPETHLTQYAQEINLAYDILKNIPESETAALHSCKSGAPEKEKKADIWKAPVNPHAFWDREILHCAETYDGDILGHICIARGKYLWTAEEDFPLFLLSIYRCSKSVLEEIDAALCREAHPFLRQKVQAELAYLLAQQFMDSTSLLRDLAKEITFDREEKPVFRVDAMLELSGPSVILNPGDTLYPSKVGRHRLYLKNQAGMETGYLSFADDRFYYIVVPLFEQKAVQVRIRVAEKQPKRRKQTGAGYQNLDLWLRLSPERRKQMPENLNLQIESLLKKYKKGENFNVS